MSLPMYSAALKKVVFPLLLIVMVMESCQKDSIEENPSPVPGANAIQVNFGAESMNVTAADSVIILLSKPGQPEPVSKKCVRQDQLFTASFNDIAAGDWKMSVAIYTNAAKENFLFTYEKDIRLPLSNNLVISAPNSLFTANWKSWLFVKDPAYTLKVPLDPTNPYFEIQVKNTHWDYLYMERNIRDQQSQVMVSADWECAGSCFENGPILKDQAAFAGFAQQVQGKNWKQGEITIFLINEAGGIDHTIYRLYDR